jgi:electron transfer flavoprotein alpha subunit
MSIRIWAFSESARVANEVAAAATAIANAAGGSVTVVGLDDSGPRLAGEDKIVVKAEMPLVNSPEAAAEALARVAKESNPDVILLGSTRNGKEIASRLAVKLGRPCVSEVFGIALADGALRGRRNVFAGKLLAEVAAPLPCVVALKVGVVEKREKQIGTVDLRGAKLIVAAGRGFKKKEDLSMASELATELGGAVGCSRPLSSDMGWLPEEHHVGLTGVSVHPDLYLAVGISGQLQHVAGIKDSKIIAAINNDKSAPIFDASDYGVVGDLYAILPAVMRELRVRHH